MRISDWSSDVCSSDLDRRFWKAKCLVGDSRKFFPGGNPAQPPIQTPRKAMKRAFKMGYLTWAVAQRPTTVQAAVIKGLDCLRIGTNDHEGRSEEHTSELQSLMRISYAVFCLKKQNTQQHKRTK